MSKLNNPLATINNPDSVKYYTAEGGKYATPSNWKKMGKMLAEGAQATLYVTKKNGFEVTLYNESQVVNYDYEAEVKKKEAEKELKAKENDILKAYRAHEITAAQMAEAIVALQTA